MNGAAAPCHGPRACAVYAWQMNEGAVKAAHGSAAHGSVCLALKERVQRMAWKLKEGQGGLREAGRKRPRAEATPVGA